MLAGEDPPGPRALAYLLGARRWLELESWPSPDARPLALEVAGGSFPAGPDAVPRVRGGRRLQGGVPGGGFGPHDQRPLLEGGHALCLSGNAPEPGLTAAGPATATLAVAASGAIRVSGSRSCASRRRRAARSSISPRVSPAPADAGEITIELGDLCIELAAGARLALLVTGGLARRFPAPASRSEQRVDGGELVLTVI